jgi:hypothetical protein
MKCAAVANRSPPAHSAGTVPVRTYIAAGAIAVTVNCGRARTGALVRGTHAHNATSTTLRRARDTQLAWTVRHAGSIPKRARQINKHPHTHAHPADTHTLRTRTHAHAHRHARTGMMKLPTDCTSVWLWSHADRTRWNSDNELHARNRRHMMMRAHHARTRARVHTHTI